MSRSKHQFRPGVLEMFEARIVPSTIIESTEPPAFTPPGHEHDTVPAAGGAIFSVDQNTHVLTGTVQVPTAQYVTFTVYSAPGGGDSDATAVGPDYNSRSQTLIYSKTIWVEANTLTQVSVDLDDLKLTGQRKLQTDFFAAGNDSSGYAPKKLTAEVVNGHILGGQLYDYSEFDAKDKDHEKR
jgi:hypothetical protein